METSLPPFVLRRATPEDQRLVLALLDGAAEWLRTKGTDQWATPWPTREQRDARIRQNLEAGRTWLVWERGAEGKGPAATVSLNRQGNPLLWSAKDQEERAVYLHRLVVDRRHAGAELGAQLVDWVGTRGRSLWDAQWIRIDVWTTNTALHGYYKKRGFDFVRCEIPVEEWPAGMLFQRPAEIVDTPLLGVEAEDDSLGDVAVVGAER